MPEPQTKKQKVVEETSKKAEDAVADATPEEIANKLLEDDTYGQTYCEQLGIDLKADDSDSLYKWLCCSMLFSSGLSEALTLRVRIAIEIWLRPFSLMSFTYQSLHTFKEFFMFAVLLHTASVPVPCMPYASLVHTWFAALATTYHML